MHALCLIMPSVSASIRQSRMDCPSRGMAWYGAILHTDVMSGEWVRRGLMASKNGATVVMLLPARTDTKWFHDYIYGKAEIRFVRGRLKFGGNSAPFLSMVVVFSPERVRQK